MAVSDIFKVEAVNFTAHAELQLFALLLALAVMLVVAARGRMPVAVFLVIGGLLLGFVPGLPQVQLPPDLVLVAILPPLLYSAAFFTGLRDLRSNLQADLAARDRARHRYHLRRGSRCTRDLRRHVLGGGVHPRSDRLADRRARRLGCRPPVRIAPAAHLDPRGREPRQRRHGARPLQDRCRGGGRGLVLALERVVAPRRERDRRHRRRSRRRLRRAPGAQARRRHADRGGDRPPLGVPRLPAGGRAGRLRRPRCGHDRRLHGLVHAAAHDGGDPPLGERVLGDPRRSSSTPCSSRSSASSSI